MNRNIIVKRSGCHGESTVYVRHWLLSLTASTVADRDVAQLHDEVRDNPVDGGVFVRQPFLWKRKFMKNCKSGTGDKKTNSGFCRSVCAEKVKCYYGQH